ncbi:MAG TPA: hypothetical protein V6C96_01835 [Vampirovibrionales bacterium]
MTSFPLGDMPLPASPWLFIPLLLLIFWLHLVAMWLMVGSLIIGVVDLIKNKAGEWKESKAIRYLPIIMAIVINLGVPPLLFLQVVYSPFFFSSSVILAVPWLSIFFLLMFAYGLIYAARYAAKKSWHAITFLTASAISVLVISFIFSNNVSLMIKPEFWGDLYSYKQNGLNLYPNLPEVISRWMWVLSPIFAAGAAMLGQSKKWFIPSALISIGALISYKSFFTPEVTAHSLVEISLIADFVLAGILLVLSFLKFENKIAQIIIFIWIALKGLAVVFLRHGIRAASLDPTYPLSDLPVQVQPFLVTIFIAALLVGGSVVAWMYINGRKELKI